MVPSAPQEAPRGTRASQMSIGKPPSASSSRNSLSERGARVSSCEQEVLEYARDNAKPSSKFLQ
jgi:hypothetical protein